MGEYIRKSNEDINVDKMTTKLPADYFLHRLIDNKPFSFSRFGDGEAMCCFPSSWLKENCDGSRFLPELQEPMKDIFRNKYNYFHCLLDCSFDLNGSKFKEFLDATCPDMQFFDGEVWQEMSFDGRITELINAVSLHYQPVFVGGSHIKHVFEMHGFNNSPIHLQVPDKDSFLYYHDIANAITDLFNEGHRMFLFSAGYTTKILIDKLFPAIGKNAFMIDLGSALDPYCLRLSRDNMRWKGYDTFQYGTKLELK